MKYLIFNLKAKLNYEEIKAYAKMLESYKNRVILAPSYLYLSYFKEQNFNLCAQDVSMFPLGNYTGEVSAEQLKSIGCGYALIGHYERRKYLKEDKQMLLAKIKQALNQDIIPIMCLSEISGNYNFEEIQEQIADILNNLEDDKEKIILAYEPGNMVASSKEIDVDRINQMLKNIKFFVQEEYSLNSEILYGGSINLNNLNILSEIEADGFLIGNLATKKEEISTLFNNFSH